MSSVIAAPERPRDPSVRLELPSLEVTGRGYHADIAIALARHYRRAIDVVALEDILKPLSDGGVLAVAHAVAARATLDLNTEARGTDLGETGASRLLAMPGLEKGRAEEVADRRLTLVQRGTAIGVQFFDGDVELRTIQQMVAERRIGLVSLDWGMILGHTLFKAALSPVLDSPLLRSVHDGAPLFFPVVPLVGYDDSNILVHTFSHPFLPIPKPVFEEARHSPRAEQTMVFISSTALRVTEPTREEQLLPLDTKRISKDFRIAERRKEKEEFWTSMKEETCGGEDPCSSFLKRARTYRMSHQTVHQIFDFVWNECDAVSPIWLYRLGQSIDKARFLEIPENDFTVFVGNVMKTARKEREDAAADSKPMDPFKVLQRFDRLVERCMYTMTSYEGAGKPSVHAVLEYLLMDLKLIEGPVVPKRERGEKRHHNTPPFPKPELNDLAGAEYTIVPPPIPGEPAFVTKGRVVIEWLEKYGGENLRNRLAQALGTGQVAIGDGTYEVFTTPLHMLTNSIRAKVGKFTPYLVGELCLNHGTSLWEMVADYDAAYKAAGAHPKLRPTGGPKVKDYLCADRWDFTVGGMLQNINESIAVPNSFAAELDYLRNVVPWALCGKLHPEYGSMLAQRFRTRDHRLSDSDGERLLDTIETAKLYLAQLLRGESRLSHDAMWKACDGIKDADLKKDIGDLLPLILGVTKLAEYERMWRKMLGLMRPDQVDTVEGLSNFSKMFIEWGMARKDELTEEARGQQAS